MKHQQRMEVLNEVVVKLNKKPEHYQGTDTFDRMTDNASVEAQLGFVVGNIDKYAWRTKGQDEADFIKIIDYALAGIVAVRSEL